MTVERVLTFCAGFFAAVVVLTIADVIDRESPAGTAAHTFRQAAFAMLVAACVAVLVIAAS
ncbi:MAG: hypothetical protein ACTHOI_06135 [Sphingomicrobium sp.]